MYKVGDRVFVKINGRFIGATIVDTHKSKFLEESNKVFWAKWDDDGCIANFNIEIYNHISEEIYYSPLYQALKEEE